MLIGLWLVGMLGAAQAESPVAATRQVSVERRRGSQKGSKKGKKKPGWKNGFYARPVLGGSSHTSSDGTTTSALGLGGEGGIRYWEVRKPFPRLRGRTRVHAQYLISSGAAEGMEIKVGSFMGPTWKYFGLSSGLDVFWNRFVWNGVPLEPTIGVGVPLIATVGVDRVGVYGGVEPAYIFNEDRRVDWSETDEAGFGHQFTIMAGINVRVDRIVVGAGYSRTVTVTGVQQGYGLSLSFRA